MKARFPGYYSLTDKEIKTLWEKCVFVLDANVLLNLYRYPEKARIDLLKAFTSIKGRLWIPFQAAIEYQRNRLTVIAEQRNKFSEVRGVISKFVPEIESRLAEMQLEKRHSSIKPDSFIKEIKEIVNKYITTLESLEKQQPDVYQPDPIRNQIESFLEVGEPPKDQKQLSQLLEDAEVRLGAKVPPGYRDLAKEFDKAPMFTYGGITYEKRFGDLILWKQLIDYAKTNNHKYLIFVTDDEKDDWWLRINSQGSKTIGPRPELVDEIARDAGVLSFHMYNSERFLKYAGDHWKLNIAADSVSQVADVRRTAAARIESQRFSVVEMSAIERFLRTKYKEVGSVAANSYVALDEEDRRIRCIVRRYTGQGTYLYLMLRIRAEAIEPTHIIIVVDPSDRSEARLRLLRTRRSLPTTVRITIGTIPSASDNDEYVELEECETFEGRSGSEHSG